MLESLEVIKTETPPLLTIEAGDIVSINYRGRLLSNGVEFDSSYNRKEPFTTQIGVGRLIRGWEEGLIGLKTGDSVTLRIPSQMGYGANSAGMIPPNSDLEFDVTILAIYK
jgi:FKBP-type peptidyl-prolyl cis-trans isomerase